VWTLKRYSCKIKTRTLQNPKTGELMHAVKWIYTELEFIQNLNINEILMIVTFSLPFVASMHVMVDLFIGWIQNPYLSSTTTTNKIK
jgi:hypothetical protein